MNKLLKLLKGKSFMGLGKLSSMAWMFRISKDEAIDEDIIERFIGQPFFFCVLSGGSAFDPVVEENVIKIPIVAAMKGRVEIEPD